MAGAGPGPHGTTPIPHNVTTVVGGVAAQTNRALVPVQDGGKAQGPRVLLSVWPGLLQAQGCQYHKEVSLEQRENGAGREAQSRGFCSLHMLSRPLVSKFPTESHLFYPWGMGAEQRASKEEGSDPEWA